MFRLYTKALEILCLFLGGAVATVVAAASLGLFVGAGMAVYGIGLLLFGTTTKGWSVVSWSCLTFLISFAITAPFFASSIRHRYRGSRLKKE